METMQVTVRDRSAEAAWGSGPTNPHIRTLTISANCPACQGPRGEPQGQNTCDDGAYYWVHIWTNPCGHVDLYADVVVEAAALAKQRGVACGEFNPRPHSAVAGLGGGICGMCTDGRDGCTDLRCCCRCRVDRPAPPQLNKPPADHDGAGD